MAKHVFLHQSLTDFKQTNKMEAFANYDAGGFQIRANFEENLKSPPCSHAALCFEAFENADEIFGEAVA